MNKQQLKEEVRKVLKEMLSEISYKQRLGIRQITQRDIDDKKEICAGYKSNMIDGKADYEYYTDEINNALFDFQKKQYRSPQSAARSKYQRFAGALKKCNAELAQLEKTFEEEQKGN